MNKLIGKTKGLIFVLVVILCIFKSGAAIVSDNDGSAFVTKSEFEILKKNLSGQIQNYNDSVDLKIDGAIASYLTGIRTAMPPENLWEKVLMQTGGKIRFRNSAEGEGEATSETYTIINVTRSYKRKVNKIWSGYLTRSSDNYNGIKYQICATSDYKKEGGQSLGYSLVEGSSLEIESATGWNNLPGVGIGSSTSKTEQKTISKSINVQDGSGSVWLYEVLPSGEKTIRSFQNTYYLSQIMNVFGHTYLNWFTTNFNTFKTRYLSATGVNDTTNLEFTMPSLTGVGYAEDNTNRKETSSEENGTWGNITLSYVTIPSLVDYQTNQFGVMPFSNVYCLNERESLTAGSETEQSPIALTVAELYDQPQGRKTRNVSYSGVKVKYKPMFVSPRSLPLNSFVNKYLSTVAGESVYLGGGAPLFETNDTEQNVKCKLKFEVYDSSGNNSTDTIKYIVSNKQFVNGNMASDANILKEDNIAVAVSGTEVEFEVETDMKGVYWINMYCDTIGKSVNITNAIFTMV